MNISRSTLLYIIMALIIIAAVLILARALLRPTYSIDVRLLPLSANGNITYNGLYPYNTTYMRIIVNNTGGSAMKNLPIVFYVNGRIYNTTNATIPGRESVPIPINYTFMASGNYTFTATADPAGLFDISDRNLATSSVSIDVNSAATPLQYETLPQNGIVKSEDALLKTEGIGTSYLFGNVYNASYFTDMLGSKISGVLLTYMAPYTASIYSAYARYENGSRAFTAWIQGTESPYVIARLLETRNISIENRSIDGVKVYYGSISSNSSYCSDYSSGWTKITFYPSNSVNCTAFVNGRNVSFEHKIGSALNASNTLLGYSGRFFYSNNVTQLGTGVVYNPDNISIVDLFYNRYGDFATVSSRTYNALSFTPVCAGEIYNATDNSSICSSSIIGLAKPLNGYALTNTTEFFPNYKFTVYSIVNSSNISTSYQSGINLINSLGVNQRAVDFASYFKDSCGTGNQSLSCSVNSFNYTTDTANIMIGNEFGKSIELRSAECYFVLGSPTVFNSIIPSGSERNVSLNCGSIGSASVGTMMNYNLELNYTYNGIAHETNGSVNITEIFS